MSRTTIKEELKTCEDAIKVLNKWIEIEWESTSDKFEEQTHIAHALYSARGVFYDLLAKYRMEETGTADGIYLVCNKLREKGYGAIAKEIESDLIVEGLI